MKRFTDAGRAALEAGNLYAALSLALTLPDICGSLEDPGQGKSRARYLRWCDQWLVPKYTTNAHGKKIVFLSAEQCWALRNSLIHSGSAEIDPKSGLDGIVFVAWESTHCNRLNNVLQLSAGQFSRDVYESADAWDDATSSNADVQSEKERLLTIHTKSVSVRGVRYDPPGPPRWSRRRER